jgi:parallel beta-helix repeat protein
MHIGKSVTQLACLTVCLMLLGSGVAGAQVLLRQPARFPIRISRPGSYRLAETLDVKGGDAILVLTGNVTIDLNGFSIVGSSEKSSGVGINAGKMAFVQVSNGSIINMTGAGLVLGSNGVVKNAHVNGNGADGIDCGNDCQILDNSVINNAEYGILAGKNAIVSGNSANDNRNGFGIAVAEGSSVTGNLANGNATGGIRGGDHTTPCSCRIVGNTANDNVIGIIVADSGVITGNVATGNGSFGICGGKSSTISGNTSNSNTGQGFIGFSGSLIQGNTAMGNQSVGIQFMQDDGGSGGYGQNVLLGNVGGDVSGGHSLGAGNTNVCSGSNC